MSAGRGEAFILDWGVRRQLIAEFLSPSSTVPKLVFGCNRLAERISALVNIDGFIDDVIDSQTFAGMPVVRSFEIPLNAIVISAIVGVAPISVERELHRLGIAHVDYFAFIKESHLDLLPVPFWAGAHEESIDNLVEYETILGRMQDEISHQTFKDVLDFRRTLDLNYMTQYVNRQNEQYFESFLQLESDNLSFYDLGCFDGFTSREFARLSPQYATISAFEPVPRLFETCVENLKHLPNCNVYNFGASDVQTQTSFTDNGSSSTANPVGEVSVTLKKLDDENLPAPSLIKIDIEGAEIAALTGMHRLLAANRPKIAVACYHYASQVRELIHLWDSMELEGDIHFRHYTEGTTESVLFLCPT